MDYHFPLVLCPYNYQRLRVISQPVPGKVPLPRKQSGKMSGSIWKLPIQSQDQVQNHLEISGPQQAARRIQCRNGQVPAGITCAT